MTEAGLGVDPDAVDDPEEDSGRCGLPVPAAVAVGAGLAADFVVTRLVGHAVSPTIGGLDLVMFALAAMFGLLGWWLVNRGRSVTSSVLFLVPWIALGALHERALLVAAPVMLVCAIAVLVVNRRR